jgi:hypothetical protein
MNRPTKFIELVAGLPFPPRGHPEPAAGAAHAGQLAGRGRVIWREHNAVRRADDVTARRHIGHRLRVADIKVDRQALLGRQSLRRLDQ